MRVLLLLLLLHSRVVPLWILKNPKILLRKILRLNENPKL